MAFLNQFLQQPDPADPEEALHAHLDSDPELEAALRQIYGIDENAPDVQPEQTFQPSGYESFLEKFAGGLQGVQAPRPHNFLEGLVTGAAQGFGAQGSRVAQARAKFEAQQTEHRKAADAAHLKASQDYRAALAGDAAGRVKGARESKAKTAEEQAKQERETRVVAPGDFAGDRLVGQRVPLSFYKPDDGSGEPLVKVQGKSGPVWVRRSEAIGQPAASDVGAAGLTPEQAALVGGMASQSGMFPALGRGGIGSPAGQAILNSMLKSSGGQTPQAVGQNLAGQKATQAAASGSLRDIEKSLSQQTVFAKKLKLNTDRLRTTAKKIVDLGPQFLNRPIREALGQLGSADQAAFNAALLPVVTESSRLLTSGPALGGQLTDSAQKELRSIISGNFNAAQLAAVLDVLENDANNGINMYTEQRDALRQEVRGGSQPGSAQSRAAPSAGAPAYKPGGFFDANRPGR